VAAARGVALLAAAGCVLAACTSGEPGFTPPPHTRAPTTSASPQPAPPAFADADVVAAVLSAAKSEVVTINTYDYRHLDKDFRAAEARTTGGYRTRLEHAHTSGLKDQLMHAKAIQQATVDHVGLVVLGNKAQGADVLVGGTLRTARTNVDPQTKRFTSVVTLTKDHGHWRVSAQNPPDGVHDEPRGNAALHDAFAAAKAHLPALYTLRYKHFDDDYNKLLSYAIGDAETALTARQNAIDTQMQKQQIDYQGSVRALSVSAVSGDSGGQVEVFGVVDATTEFHGVKGAARHWQLDATLTRSRTHWLISQFAAVAVT
jgi:hypothetical protein